MIFNFVLLDSTNVTCNFPQAVPDWTPVWMGK